MAVTFELYMITCVVVYGSALSPIWRMERSMLVRVYVDYFNIQIWIYLEPS